MVPPLRDIQNVRLRGISFITNSVFALIVVYCNSKAPKDEQVSEKRTCSSKGSQLGNILGDIGRAPKFYRAGWGMKFALQISTDTRLGATIL